MRRGGGSRLKENQDGDGGDSSSQSSGKDTDDEMTDVGADLSPDLAVPSRGRAPKGTCRERLSHPLGLSYHRRPSATHEILSPPTLPRLRKSTHAKRTEKKKVVEVSDDASGLGDGHGAATTRPRSPLIQERKPKKMRVKNEASFPTAREGKPSSNQKLTNTGSGRGGRNQLESPVRNSVTFDLNKFDHIFSFHPCIGTTLKSAEPIDDDSDVVVVDEAVADGFGNAIDQDTGLQDKDGASSDPNTDSETAHQELFLGHVFQPSESPEADEHSTLLPPTPLLQDTPPAPTKLAPSLAIDEAHRSPKRTRADSDLFHRSYALGFSPPKLARNPYEERKRKKMKLLP